MPSKHSNGNENGQGTNGSKTDQNGGDQEDVRRRHKSSESEVSVESMEEYIPTPPDGGWGWVIVVASLVANLIVDGISYSFGVFLLEFVETFDAPKSKIALVGSLLSGTYLFAGPIVSAMTNKFGCRPVVITGSVIATTAFVLATLSPSVGMLIITYGVLGGFGMGMMYLPSIVSVGYYFEKKRAFATGIAVCGSGFGTFMIPPLAEYLLQEYAWQGGLLIIAGIIFHGCVCGVLMRPLEAKPVKKAKQQKETNTQDSLKEPNDSNKNKLNEPNNRTRAVSESCANTKKSEVNSKLERGKTPKDKEQRRQSAEVSTSESIESPKKDKAVPGSPSSIIPTIVTEDVDEIQRNEGNISPEPNSDAKVSETGESSAQDAASTDKSEYFTPPESAQSSPMKSPVTPEEVDGQRASGDVPALANGGVVRDGEEGDNEKKADSTDDTEDKYSKIKTTAQFMSEFAPLLEVPAPRIHSGAAAKGSSGGPGGSRTNISLLMHSQRSLHISKRDLARPLYRKDIFYSGSVLNIPQFQSQPDIKSYITSITTIPGEMDFVDGPSPSSKVINLYCSCIPRPARDVLSEMMDVSLLKDVGFMLICLGNICAFLGFFIPFVYIVDRAVSLGVEKTQAAFLISIIGITNTGGRVLVGKLADLRIIDSLVITYLSIALCGLMTFLIPFCDTYPLMATACAIFGLGVAAYISLSSIIICDRMGLEKLTNAFGLMSLARGIASMVGSPLAGYMFDSTGSYDMSFYLGGLLLFLGAVCHAFLHLPCLKPKHEQSEHVFDEMIGEEMIGEEQVLGSKPQLVTMKELEDENVTSSAV